MGWLPALTACDRAAGQLPRRSASAIWERALLPVHRNSTRAAPRPGAARVAAGAGRERRVQRAAGRGEQLAAAGQVER